MRLVKKALSILALVIGMQFNVFIMVCIKAFQDFVCTFVNAEPNKKLLGYDIAHQWMDVAPPAALSVVMCGAVMVCGFRLCRYG